MKKRGEGKKALKKKKWKGKRGVHFVFVRKNRGEVLRNSDNPRLKREGGRFIEQR